MSYGICIWDPYAFACPQDYIPTDLAEAENIRWQQLEGSEDEDGNIINPPPVLPENPKFAAFLADLQELAKQERFSATFRGRYGDCTEKALESVGYSHNLYFVLPAPYREDSTGEHFLALYELVQRHRLVMFDQDSWLVMLPDGGTLPEEFAAQLPRIQRQLQQLKQEHLTYSVDSGRLPQQIQTFAEYFVPSIDAYFASRGYQIDPTAVGVVPQYSKIHCKYIKHTDLTDITVWLSIEKSHTEYRVKVKFDLFVPKVDAYLQHVKETPVNVGSHMLMLEDDRVHNQFLTQPSDLEICLAKCQPMLDFLDQINNFDQLLELQLKPAPLDPDAKINQSQNSPYSRLYADLPAMVLMRIINQPEKYAPIIEQSYQYALTGKKLNDEPGRYYQSKRYPKKKRREVFLLDWATLTELLDRDYPPSAD